VLAPEDGIEDVLAPRFTAAGADMSRVHFGRGVVIPLGEDTEHVVLPDHLDALATTVAEHEIKMIWIDSLITTLPERMKSISYSDVSRALQPLNRFAAEHGVAIVGPWHLNQSGARNSAGRIMDSLAFRTNTRSMIMVLAAGSDAPGEGIVALDKANAGSTQVPALRYRIVSGRYPVHENGVDIEAQCGVAEWIGEEELSGRELIDAAFSPDQGSQPNPTQEWLKNLLEAAGEVERQEVLTAATSVGISVSSVQRAARALDVQKRQESGQHQETGRPWRKTYWRLP
jgi:hypothetical protein